jgi:hypothetical protein
MKKRLEQSTWLRNELKDGGLRYLIGMIDAASDGDEEDWNKKPSDKKGCKYYEGVTPRVLALARSKSSYPKFASFVDQMLLTAGVLQPVEGSVGNEGQLSLVDVPRRCRSETDDGSDEGFSEEESSGSDDSSSSDDGNDESSSEGNSCSEEEDG